MTVAITVIRLVHYVVGGLKHVWIINNDVVWWCGCDWTTPEFVCLTTSECVILVIAHVADDSASLGMGWTNDLVLICLLSFVDDCWAWSSSALMVADCVLVDDVFELVFATRTWSDSC